MGLLRNAKTMRLRKRRCKLLQRTLPVPLPLHLPFLVKCSTLRWST